MLHGKVVPKLRRTGVKLYGSGLAKGLFLYLQTGFNQYIACDI